MDKKTAKFLGIILSVLLVSFCGGFVGFIFTGLWKGPLSASLGDPVSIANTYIVFTTIIFVGITLVIGLMGFIFTQQFAMAKEMQVEHLIAEIEDELRSNLSDRGIKLIDAALENPDVQAHIEEKIESKLKQLIAAKVASSKNTAKKSAEEAVEAESLANMLNGAQ